MTTMTTEVEVRIEAHPNGHQGAVGLPSWRVVIRNWPGRGPGNWEWWRYSARDAYHLARRFTRRGHRAARIGADTCPGDGTR